MAHGPDVPHPWWTLRVRDCIWTVCQCKREIWEQLVLWDQETLFQETLFSPVTCAGDVWPDLPTALKKRCSQEPWRTGTRMVSAKGVFCGTKTQHNIAEKILSSGVNWKIHRRVMRTEIYCKSSRITIAALRQRKASGPRDHPSSCKSVPDWASLSSKETKTKIK